jgi:hypothetical protein
MVLQNNLLESGRVKHLNVRHSTATIFRGTKAAHLPRDLALENIWMPRGMED